MRRTLTKAALVLPALACGAAGLAQARQTPPVEPPAVVRAVAPFFHPFAVAARAAGEVTAKVEVNHLGEPVTVEVSGGARLLQESVRDAARRWRFSRSESLTPRTVSLSFVFEYEWKSHGSIPPEEMTPVFVPPYKVIVKKDLSDR